MTADLLGTGVDEDVLHPTAPGETDSQCGRVRGFEGRFEDWAEERMRGVL